MKNLIIAVLMLVTFVSFVSAQDQPVAKPSLPIERKAEKVEVLYSPNSSVLFAKNDINKVRLEDRQYMRYFSIYNVPADKRLAYKQTLSFLINSLSRRKTIIVPTVVKESEGTVLRIDLRDYDIPSTAWDKLGKNGSGVRPKPEPYFHVAADQFNTPVDVQSIAKTRNVLTGYDRYNRPVYSTEQYIEQVQATGKTEVKRILTSGPWLNANSVADLVANTQTDFPIFRGDWAITNMSLPPAYYDFLSLGNKEEDFEKLVFADNKLAEKARVQTKGIVISSIITRNNRTLTRSPTFTGGAYWQSHDTLTSTDDRDYVKTILDEKFDAKEIIANLPNGLQAYFLVNAQNVRQDAAPTDIAIDYLSADKTVRNGRSCFVCHNTGIQPINDEIRKITEKLTKNDNIALFTSDYTTKLLIRDLFGSNLDKEVKKDQEKFQEAVLEATEGLKAEDSASQFSSVYDNYAEKLLTIEDVARDVGVSAEMLREYITRSRDVHVLSLTKNPIRSLRRDHWEQSFSEFMLIVIGGNSP